MPAFKKWLVLFVAIAPLVSYFWYASCHISEQELRKQIKPVTAEELRSVSELVKAKQLLSKVFNHPIDKITTFTTTITITGYSAVEEECDVTPWVTANGDLSVTGVIAGSRDLFDEVGLELGQRILVQVGDFSGVFVLADKMNKRFYRRIDILFGNAEAARRFGKRQGTITWL